MQKGNVREAILNTQNCLIKYWQKEYQYAIDKLGEEITWIGALQEEFMVEKSLVIEDIKQTSLSNPSCHLLQQEFWCISEDRKTCTIVGRYLVTTDGASGELIQEQQRATFIWKEQEEGLKIIHMHISSPLGYLEPGEQFPHKIGRTTYQYLQDMLAKQKGMMKNIEVREKSGHIRFISMAEIEYAEAMNHDTVITTIDCTITARISWKKFLEFLGDEFIRVHRSYVVNLRYIKCFKANKLEMQSGKLVPVPAKKVKEVYDKWRGVFCSTDM